MKLAKIAAAVLGGLIGLLIVAAVLVAWLFDPNDYKDTLAAEFERRTGRSLAIGDNLAFEYLPWLAVETGDITIGHAAGFAGDRFAHIERASARLRLRPLLAGRIEMGTIELDGLALELETDADGRGNWMPGDASAAADADSAGRDAGAAAARWVENLNIAGLRVRNGTVRWRDTGSGAAYALTDISLTSGEIATGRRIDIEIGFTIAGAGVAGRIDTEAALELAADGSLTAYDWRTGLDATADDAFAARGTSRIDRLSRGPDGRIATAGGQFTGMLTMAALGPGARDVAIGWQAASFDPAAGTLGVDALTTAVDGIEARWELSNPVLTGAPRAEGRLDIAAASIASAGELLGIEWPDGIDAAALGTADVTTRFRFTAEPYLLELDAAELTMLGARATGRATVSGDAPRIEAVIDVPAFAPSQGLRALLAPHVPAGVELAAFDRIGLAARLDIDAAARSIAIRDLRGEVLGARIDAAADVMLEDAGLVATGRLATSPISPQAFVAAFDALLTDTVDRRELGPTGIDASFDYDGRADRLTLDIAALNAFGLSASGELTAANLSTAPVYTGRARLPGILPRPLIRRFGQTPPQTSDPDALSRAAIDTRFEITPERGTFRELTLTLDDSRITGEFTVEDFIDPSYRFALAIDRLDADRYLPPRADDADAGDRTAGDLELTGDALDVLRMSGRVDVGNLTLAGMAFQQVTTSIDVGRGALRLSDASAQLYGGRFDGDFSVDASGELPAMRLNGRAANLALAPVITALTGDANLSGTGSFDIALAGSGITVTDNLRSAAGTMGFTLRDGAITGFDVGRMLCQAYNATQRLPGPPAADPAETRYLAIQGTSSVTGGVASSTDLLARTAYMDVNGRGQLDLVEQTLNYNLEAKLTAPVDIPNCSSMDRFVGGSIPFVLRGSVADPELLPDFSEILRREIRERATDSLEERLRNRLRDLL